MSNHTQNSRPPLRTSEETISHPSLCKCNAYSQSTQQVVVQYLENGDDESSVVSSLRSQHSFLSHRSVLRLVDCFEEHGNFRPYLHSGNKRATREI